ncbi:hypothetical protein DPMN_047136 [Dreissena polymorpha]|uniref:Mab-21-like HhH/H2TH-like domain-containing protein n=1 Tax=Dreissena polymorpha TaxID=45954 RepID=A0A9D4D869_DREPO|nr:hypothetical protein DPMN_047136 [Dreissena polymorpha]
MIRKESFLPGYRNRLSTFHFKTAFFLAIENTRPDVWREDNLISCVKYILAFLKRFLTRRNCLHFTIEYVNMFDGKIERHEFPNLVDKITYVVNSLRTQIENMQMDNIGKTLNQRSARNNGRYCSNNAALFTYVVSMCHVKLLTFNGIKISEAPINYRKDLFENEYTLLQTYYTAPLGNYRKYEYKLIYVISALASTLASVYLEEKAQGLGYNYDAINKLRQMYTHFLESDIICNYMRYASFLFCNGEYDEARTYFDLIERQIEDDNKSNLIYQLFVSPSELLALQIAKQSCVQNAKQQRSVFLPLVMKRLCVFHHS